MQAEEDRVVWITGGGALSRVAATAQIHTCHRGAEPRLGPLLGKSADGAGGVACHVCREAPG